MVNLNVNSTVNKDALSTNLTRGSQEVKDERLKNAKNMVAKLNEQEEARALLKFSFGCILTLILFVVSYFIVSLFLFKGNEFILQIFYAGLLSGFLGYILTVLIIVTGTFFDSRDYSLLSLLLPVTSTDTVTSSGSITTSFCLSKVCLFVKVTLTFLITLSSSGLTSLIT